MAKSKIFENKAFESAPLSVGFNLVPKVNSFTSIFDMKPLDNEEQTELEQLLHKGAQPENMAAGQIANDISHLQQITAEIKAISKQGAVLVGERVYRAREILKPYRDGTFTQWLESTFGARKSGYNALSYYELYIALPDEVIREIFKKLQHRTAYILASRIGDIATKSEIISQYHDKSHSELLAVIQEKLPVPVKDKRKKKASYKKLVTDARKIIEKLHDRKSELSTKDRGALSDLREIIHLILT